MPVDFENNVPNFYQQFAKKVFCFLWKFLKNYYKNILNVDIFFLILCCNQLLIKSVHIVDVHNIEPTRVYIVKSCNMNENIKNWLVFIVVVLRETCSITQVFSKYNSNCLFSKCWYFFRCGEQDSFIISFVCQVQDLWFEYVPPLYCIPCVPFHSCVGASFLDIISNWHSSSSLLYFVFVSPSITFSTRQFHVNICHNQLALLSLIHFNNFLYSSIFILFNSFLVP